MLNTQGDVTKEVLAKEFLDIENFENIKKYLLPKLINHKANQSIILNMPYMEVEDLVVIYQIFIPEWRGKADPIAVTNQLMRLWGVELETLHVLAMENNLKNFPPILKTMKDIWLEISDRKSGVNYFTNKELFLKQDRDVMYVLNNRGNLFAAVNILYPEILKSMIEVFPDGYYILPSSVHELIILPKREKRIPSVNELLEIVRSINSKEVAMDEVLSNAIYEYTKGDERFRLVNSDSFNV